MPRREREAYCSQVIDAEWHMQDMQDSSWGQWRVVLRENYEEINQVKTSRKKSINYRRTSPIKVWGFYFQYLTRGGPQLEILWYANFRQYPPHQQVHPAVQPAQVRTTPRPAPTAKIYIPNHFRYQTHKQP